MSSSPRGATSPAERVRPRLFWLDAVKGISILWIVFFHAFGTYTSDSYPSPVYAGYWEAFVRMCNPAGFLEQAGCAVQAVAVAVVRVGFHAVAVFLLLSGFGLAYGLARSGGPPAGWGDWYERRLVRLFPMYWTAHLLYLVSPFVARPEPIDYRFILSFLGDRIYPIYSIFYYMNPALWYFGLLLQLYLVFPLLYLLLRRLGRVRFLLLCATVTVVARHLMVGVLPVHGYYLQGGFFVSRLWEFAAGVALGDLCFHEPEETQRRLFLPISLLAAAGVYALGIFVSRADWSYPFADGLTGIGLFVLLAHVARWFSALPRLSGTLQTVGAFSYGVYLVHQPYVTYFAERMRGFRMAAFVPATLVLMAIITLAAIPLERAVNRLTDRVLDSRRRRSLPAA